MKRKLSLILTALIAFSSINLASTPTPLAHPQIVPAVKTTGKAVYRGSKYVGKKTWRGTRYVGKKVYRGGRWVAVKTAKGVKWVFVGNKKKRRY